jgi:hypothetical protein
MESLAYASEINHLLLDLDLIRRRLEALRDEIIRQTLHQVKEEDEIDYSMYGPDITDMLEQHAEGA